MVFLPEKEANLKEYTKDLTADWVPEMMQKL
jgi:hypothetical protein